MPKSGLKTTEFWMHLVIQIILLLNTTDVTSQIPAKWAGVAQVVLAGAYAIARGLAKMNATSAVPLAAASYPPIEPPGDTTEA